nr:hypothetical protein [Mucilaginibacter sp. X5P1]
MRLFQKDSLFLFQVDIFLSRYQAQNCLGFLMWGVCHQGQGNRISEVNHSLRKHTQQTKKTPHNYL